MKNKLIKLNTFEIILIIGIMISNIISFIITKDTNWIGIASSITGVICVVMTAKGHISCYYWGIINILTYIIVAYQTGFYGEVIENGAYHLPMQFIGIYLWKKNLNKETKLVKAKSMSIKEMIISSIVTIIGIIIFGYFLKSINSYQPFWDSATNMLAILAMYLSVRRFKEQWICWIIIDVITVYMWAVAFIDGQANSLVMLIMWSFYLINAIYGYINWIKLERSNKNV